MTANKVAIGLVVAGLLLVLAGANAHLVYVSVTSQPGCIDHVRQGDHQTGMFQAASSACSPEGRSGGRS
jgi:hypothetical protein